MVAAAANKNMAAANGVDSVGGVDSGGVDSLVLAGDSRAEILTNGWVIALEIV